LLHALAVLLPQKNPRDSYIRKYVEISVLLHALTVLHPQKNPRDYYIGELIEVSVLLYSLAVLHPQKKSRNCYVGEWISLRAALDISVKRKTCLCRHKIAFTPPPYQIVRCHSQSDTFYINVVVLISSYNYLVS